MAELAALLEADADWLSLADFPGIAAIQEDGSTFAENARRKALGYARLTGCWTIADDSGLMVDALGGRPGVRSARFSGDRPAHKDRSLLDHRNMQKLLALLKGLPPEKRAARFVCALCLADPQKVLAEVQGVLEGVIAEAEAGSNGFGYDPVFFLPSLGKTVAQLTAAEKNAVSHRGRAAAKLRPLLLELLRK
jgi:XTP/dITP diphosphohydrolase